MTSRVDELRARIRVGLDEAETRVAELREELAMLRPRPERSTRTGRESHVLPEIDALLAHRGPMRLQDVAIALKVTPMAAAQALSRGARAGRYARPRRGVYGLPVPP